MIRMLATIRRRPGMTVSEYLHYIVDVHGKIAQDNPLTLRRYHQLHVSDGSYGQTGDEKHSAAFSRDSVTELWFENMDSLSRCFADPYTKNVTGPDGKNFSDVSSPISLIADEEESHGDTAPGERTKLLWFVKRADGVASADFRSSLTEADAAAADAALVAGVQGRSVAPALRSKEATDLLSYFGSVGISYDGVIGLWINAADPVVAARAYEAAFAEAAEDWLDRSTSFWLIGREHVVLDLTKN